MTKVKIQYREVIDQIIKWHGNKFRAFSLCPYFIHPIKTASLVSKYKGSLEVDESIIAALLHDVVEDTEITFDELEQKYGKKITDLVRELTSDKETIKQRGKIHYLSHRMVNMSSEALLIKLCDRLDNVSDFIYASQSFIDRYAEETRQILNYVEKHRKNLNAMHRCVIEDIWEVLMKYKAGDWEQT